MQTVRLGLRFNRPRHWAERGLLIAGDAMRAVTVCDRDPLQVAYAAAEPAHAVEHEPRVVLEQRVDER
jgi:hypothetical protein